MRQAGPTVSVVDDDPSVRKALRRLIRSAGLDVTTYPTAALFLAAGDGPAPACLVLDVRMPDMDGLELQRRLACDGRSIPIVFISGHDDAQVRRAALAAGAVDFLQKPFEERQLLGAVARALARCPAGEPPPEEEVTNP